MITLNSERGLVQIASWDDVLALPGFTANVDYKTRKLAAIVGRYVFSDWIPCGLVSCRKPHGRGFVVAIDGGQLTNIGKDCGKTHFGVDFVTMSRAFERDARNAERRERLVAFQASIPFILARIDELRVVKRGDWIFKTAHLFRSTNSPAPVRDALSRLVRARDGRLMKARLETEAEAAAREAMVIRESESSEEDDTKPRKPRRLMVDDQIAFIEGLPIFYPELDVRELLIRDVLPRLKIIEALSVSNLSEPELRDHAKWVAAAEEKLARAERAIEEGDKFLRHRNLAPFAELITSSSDTIAFLSLLKPLMV